MKGDDTVQFSVSMTVIYVVLGVIGLGVLAFAWREAPAVIRYIKSEMM